MAARDQIVAELNRRVQQGNLSGRQTSALAELRRRGVLPREVQAERPDSTVLPADVQANLRQTLDAPSRAPRAGTREAALAGQVETALTDDTPSPLAEQFKQIEPAYQSQDIRRRTLQDVAGGLQQTEQQLSPEGLGRAMAEAQPDLPVARGLAAGLQSFVTGKASLAQRVFGQQEEADRTLREQAASQADLGLLDRAVSSGVDSIATMLSTSLGGPVAMYGTFAADAMNRAAEQGRAQGLEGAALGRYVAGEGAIEAGISAAFHKIGLGGLETRLLQPAKRGVGNALRQFGITTLGELPEEIAIEVTSAIHGQIAGADPEELTADRLARIAAETAFSTLVTVGMAEGGRQVLGRRRTQQDPTGQAQQPQGLPDGVTYEGEQTIDDDDPDMGSIALYTDEQTGSTIAVAPGESLDAKLRQTREKFAKREKVATPLLLPDEASIAESRLRDAEQDLARAQAEERNVLPPTASAQGAITVDPEGVATTPEQASPQAPESARRRTEVSDAVTEEADALIEQMQKGRGPIDSNVETQLRALVNEARRNPLTGGMNRNAFERVYKAVTLRAKRTKKPVSILAFDAANLKTYNDKVGESAGDEYLRRVQDAIAGALRGEGTSDRVGDTFHYGGDEWAVILPDTDAAGAAVVRDRVEQAFGREQIVPGVSAFLVGESATIEAGRSTPWRRVLDQATSKMKTRKAELKKAAGEATTREGAEAAAAKAMPVEQRPLRRVIDAQKEVRRRRAEYEAAMQKTRKAPAINAKLRRLARNYAEQAGRELPQVSPRRLAVKDAYRLARDYTSMRHDPTDPRVAASYRAFVDETFKQYEHLVAEGYNFEPWLGAGQPYANVVEMARDVAENKHLYYFRSTDTTTTLPDDHPMLEQLPNGMLANDVFRAVHDIYGHAKDGYGFDIPGEENAWRSHSQMYSAAARGAMTTETRGQSTWVGYGPQGEANRKAVAEDREDDVVFAPQKAGLLPDEWWQAEGLDPTTGPNAIDPLDPDALAEATVPMIDRLPNQSAIRQGFQKAIVPTGTIIRNFAPRLYGRIKQMQAGYRRDRHDADYQAKMLEDMLTQSVDQNTRDRIYYNLQIGDFPEAHRLMDTSENGSEIKEQLTTLLNLKDQWRADAIDAGLKIGEIENHFPRAVKPGMYQQWADKLHGEERSELDLMLQEAQRKKGGQPLSKEEKAEVANKWMAGYRHHKPGETSPRTLSRRSVEDLSFEDWKEFYQQGMNPLYTYFDRLIYNTHKARLFGKKTTDENWEETLGRMMVEGKYGIDRLTRYQKDRLRDAVDSIFTGGEQSPAKALRVIRDLGYFGTLVDPSSAAIQLGDFALVAARDGTLPGLSSIPRAMREKVLTAKNLGMEHLSEEYGSHGKLSTALRRGFKAVGFHKIDTAALTVNMVSAVRSGRRIARKPQDSKAFKRWAREWGPIFGEDFSKLVRDLRNDTNSAVVQDYAYLQASEVRPVDPLDMPQWYNKYPNARIFWQLKGFAMKQFDFIKNRAYRKMAQGVRQQDPKLAAEGLGDLVRLMLMLGLAGATMDWLRDWALGRNPDFSKSLVDGLLYTHLGSTYMFTLAGREGPGSAAWDMVGPPAFGAVDQLWRDMANGTYHTVKYLPFGKTLYAFTPQAATLEAEKARANALKAAATAKLNGDHRAASTYIRLYNDTMRAEGRTDRLTMSSVNRSVRARQRED